MPTPAKTRNASAPTQRAGADPQVGRTASCSSLQYSPSSASARHVRPSAGLPMPRGRTSTRRGRPLPRWARWLTSGLRRSMAERNQWLGLAGERNPLRGRACGHDEGRRSVRARACLSDVGRPNRASRLLHPGSHPYERPRCCCTDQPSAPAIDRRHDHAPVLARDAAQLHPRRRAARHLPGGARPARPRRRICAASRSSSARPAFPCRP